jgi:hypothetical protein
MPYAVVQTELTAPTEEQLVQAFAATTALTAADARQAARHQYGVIAEGLAEEDARALQQALAGLGLTAAVIDQAELPLLPPAKSIRRVDCLPEALQLYDGMGRMRTIAWDAVLLVAAGNVGYLKEVTTVAPGAPHIHVAGIGGQVVYADTDPPERERREVSTSQMVVEIHTTIDPYRYQAKLPGLLFTYLGPCLTNDHDTNLRMVLGDLLRLAPQALMNRGASMLTQDPPQSVVYNSRVDFEKELRWLRWWGQRPE